MTAVFNSSLDNPELFASKFVQASFLGFDESGLTIASLSKIAGLKTR